MNRQSLTIAALATPPGYGGIGIVRISGPDACRIAKRLFRRNVPKSKPLLGSTEEEASIACHHLTHGYICDPERNQVIDEVFLAIMKAPRSYTREDVVEIQSHSGPIILRLIMELILKNGARLAEPGEFTKRAFLNGRIDLSQAEAVCDIISAKSEKSLQLAQELMSGGLKKRVEDIGFKILEVLVELQAQIEFDNEIADTRSAADLGHVLQKDIIEQLEDLVRASDEARIYREGIRLAVVGRPNVGKSSLLNRLLEKERSIVTPIPGTTRDVIEDEFTVQGIPVIISDTAGIQATCDPVETIGIRKAFESIAGADLVFFIIEAQDPFNPEDLEIYKKIKSQKLVYVINKIDLIVASAAGFQWKPFSEARCVSTSALQGLGIQDLKDAIVAFFKKDYTYSGLMEISLNIRQKNALKSAAEAMKNGLREMQNSATQDLAALSIQESLNCLGEITGETIKIDILDSIFQKFCIGK